MLFRSDRQAAAEDHSPGSPDLCSSWHSRDNSRAGCHSPAPRPSVQHTRNTAHALVLLIYHSFTHTLSPSRLHTFTLSLTHFHSLSYTLSLSLSFKPTFTLAFSHTLVYLSFTHTHTHTHTLSLSSAHTQNTFALTPRIWFCVRTRQPYRSVVGITCALY